MQTLSATRTRQLEWFLHAFFWLFFFGFVLFFSLTNISKPVAYQRSIFVFVCHVINFYVCYLVLIPRLFEKGRYVSFTVALISWVILFFVIRMGIEKRLMLNEIVLGNLSLRGVRFFAFFSVVGVASFACLLKLAINYEGNKRKLSALRQLQLETELRFLKAQMNPHFLFNTINNIYALALIKSDKVPAALMKLSSLLRYLLYESGEKVTLDKEIKALESYAELFQLRYEQPLDLKLHLHEPINRDMLIDGQLLLPLFENAIKHSGLGVDENARVEVNMKQRDADFWFEITNSVFQEKPDDEPGGIGLSNLRKRLEMRYADRHELKIAAGEHTFFVSLKLTLS